MTYRNKVVFNSLIEISGKDHVSDNQAERYLYARDSSLYGSGNVDYVVAPGSSREVSEIVKVASENSIPIVPLGAGLNLAGLTVPLSGGIVMDLKRLSNIVKVDEESRYAVIEAGVTIGGLIWYMKKNHPSLRYSIADAPPTSTVVGNMLTSGNGQLSKYGLHSEMINGLEVVLPDGQICLLGACALSDSWHGNKMMPDLSGLFIDWLGATGIVTKMAVKLYPVHRLRDCSVFMIRKKDAVEDILKRLTFTEIPEDLLVMVSDISGPLMITLFVYLTAELDEELVLKKKIIENAVLAAETQQADSVHPDMLPAGIKEELMNEPKGGFEQIADARQGGGFGYVGAFIPYGRLGEVYDKGVTIAEKYGFTPNFAIRNIGVGHGLSFSFSYPFNRADEESMEVARKASDETNTMCVEYGGILWKPARKRQKMILERMNRSTAGLMQLIKKAIDPKDIMNPGMWG